MFAQQLADVRRITLADVDRYGVSADQLEGIKERCTQWPLTFATNSPTTSSAGLTTHGLRGLAERMRAYPF